MIFEYTPSKVDVSLFLIKTIFVKTVLVGLMCFGAFLFLFFLTGKTEGVLYYLIFISFVSVMEAVKEFKKVNYSLMYVFSSNYIEIINKKENHNILIDKVKGFKKYTDSIEIEMIDEELFSIYFIDFRILKERMSQDLKWKRIFDESE